MPYIKKDDRGVLDPFIEDLSRNMLAEPGQLNYVITKLLLKYLKACGLRYKSVNEIMGVLSCVTQEFYRRVVVPYENKKRDENGDVF